MILVGSLFLQLLPHAMQAWREWPRPGFQTSGRAVLEKPDGECVKIQYLIYLPQNYSPPRRSPILLYLHGAGERGSDLTKVLRGGPPGLIAKGREFPLIVVSPQCPLGASWDSQQLLQLIDHIGERFTIDPDRIYVGGFSMGAFGTWDLASTAPERFAAIVPVAGGGHTTSAERLIKLPIWAFHGANDRTVPLAGSVNLIHAIRELGGRATLTVYDGMGHDTGDKTFCRDDLYEWLLMHRRPANDK